MENNTTTSQDPCLTMSDYLDHMVQEEEAVQKILAKDETQQCTYPKGYSTQTLFGCNTCGSKGGMCLACYLSCHLDHDTFEIGEKRNFRCDCGTDKFNNHPCCLIEDKTTLEENTKNQYDHNFEAKFCVCNSAYEQNQFMIRCLHCQDFFHMFHLNLSEDIQKVVEGNEEFTQMICGDCKIKHYKFLLCYREAGNIYYTEEELLGGPQPQPETKPAEPPVLLGKRSRSYEAECIIKDKLKELENQQDNKAVFMKEEWNNNICFCDDCIRIYEADKVYDILTEDVNDADNAEEPETQAETGVTSQDPFQDQSLYTQAMQELGKLDFTYQTAIASLYRDFYEDFKGFFEKFKENNIVITQHHIQEFFAQLKGKSKDIPAWA